MTAPSEKHVDLEDSPADGPSDAWHRMLLELAGRNLLALAERDSDVDTTARALESAQKTLREFQQASTVWGRTAAEIIGAGIPEPDWLIPGILARGWSLDINAREKEGKGQFITNMLGHLERAEPTLFGAGPRDPVTSLIFTEEPEDTMGQKLDDAQLAASLVVYHHELSSAGQWADRWPLLLERCVADGHGVLFVDNVSRATATEDEAGTELARHVEPLLDEAKRQGVAVILDRHQRKSGGKIEDLGRGSTAMAGAVESILALQRVGDWQSRKRKLYARGRHPASRWERVIELSEDRRTYTEATVDPNIDARDLALADRTEWTATELAGATGYSEDACRSWLKTSARTEQIGQGGRGQTLRFRVIAVPELD